MSTRGHGRAAWIALAVLLTSCQPLPHPFAEDRPPAALVAVPNNVDVAVGFFDGEPRGTAAKLPAAMAKALVKRGIPASDATRSKSSYRLDGRIEQRPDQPGKTLLTVLWRLRDPKGNVVSERSDRLSAPSREWSEGNDERIAQLATAGAGGLAALLIDDTPKPQPVIGPVRVAIRKVDGAPGDGNEALASSLRAALKHRDIELVDAAKGGPEVAIDAEVKLDPAKDGKQHVKIVWRVARADGAEIGMVAQENDVPRGRLDAAWGDVAYSVAMAAEGSIMELVDRGAPSRRRAPPMPTAVATSPSGPPVAGNLDLPAVNLPPVNVTPTPGTPPLATTDVPVLLPRRGVPLPSH